MFSLEIFVVLLISCFTIYEAEDLPRTNFWTGPTFPNPQIQEDLKICNINQKSGLCDPDNILTETARNNIIKYFEKIQKRTTKNNGTYQCEKQGIIGGVAIANHFLGGNTQTLAPQAINILRRWNLDPNCDKSFVIVLSHLNRSVFLAANMGLPVTTMEIKEIFKKEEHSLQNGEYEKAIINILDELAKKAMDFSRDPFEKEPTPIGTWIIIFVITVVFVGYFGYAYYVTFKKLGWCPNCDDYERGQRT